MVSHLFTLLIITAIAGSISSAAEFNPINFKNCNSKYEIVGVESNCKIEDGKCVLSSGEEPLLKIVFKPTAAADGLKVAVKAKLDTSFVEFHLENEDACVTGNLKCPLTVGDTQTYIQGVPIRPEYPNVDVQVNWQLFDTKTNEKAVCVVFLGSVRN
uniref:ML domain-containing protein n=1 Tax=Rhabditophanes sp. KR3021 TaxID=114890 RepID=A0AC35UBZ1_9BILA